MSLLFSSQADDHLLYDSNLKTALKKTKLIEKRISDRTQTMKQKLIEFKNACRIIRFQELLSQPSESHLSTIDSKELSKQNSRRMSQAQNQEDSESAKEEDIKREKTEAKVQKVPETKIEAYFPLAKIQFQGLNQSYIQEAQENSLITNQQTEDEKGKHECEKNESSMLQKSEYQTPKFPESEKESSFGLKSPIRGDDQSFITENQDYQRARNANIAQSLTNCVVPGCNLTQQNISTNQKTNCPVQPSSAQYFTQAYFRTNHIVSQPQTALNYNIFSFSNLPQNQEILNNHISNQQASQIQTYQISNTFQESEKENIKRENALKNNIQKKKFSNDNDKQEPQPPVCLEKIEQASDENIMLKSVDKSVVESVDGKSQSFNQIYDHFQKFFKVNQPHDTPQKKSPNERTIEQNEAPKKEPPETSLPNLTVNSQFPLILANSQRVAKNKNRLFKEKRKKKNSSDKSSSD